MLRKPDGRAIRITATPARHGPAGIEPLSGDVIGFVLVRRGMAPIYVTGDTVWYDGVAEVARRFEAGTVLLFAGAAQTRGPFNLTMDINDAIELAHRFPTRRSCRYIATAGRISRRTGMICKGRSRHSASIPVCACCSRASRPSSSRW